MRRRLITPFNVGLLGLAGVGFFIYSMSIVKKGLSSQPGLYRLFAVLDDASGITEKSRVLMAGILVGEVEKIELAETRARITLKMSPDAKLREDALLSKRQASFLGGYFLEFRAGSPEKRLLADGDEVKNVDTAGVFDQFRDEAKALSVKVHKVLDDVAKLTSGIVKAVGDDQAATTLRKILNDTATLASELSKTAVDNTGRIERIMKSLERFSVKLAGVASSSGWKVDKILGDIQGLVASIREVAGKGAGKIESNLGTIDGVMGNVRDSTESLRKAMANMAEVLEKVNSGKGLAGKLVGDAKLGERVDQIANKVEETVANTNQLVKNANTIVGETSDIIGKLTRLQTIIGARTEYNVYQKAAKTYFGVTLQPKEDKFYRLQFVVDPKGKTSTTKTVRTTDETGATKTINEEIGTTTDSLKFSAELAKRFGFLTVRGGVIENSGGVGADLSFFRDKANVNLDLFDMTKANRPRFKVTGSYTFLRHFYIGGGVDDALNSATRDYFVGGGITFTDDDLKAILLTTPTPK